MEQAKKKVDVIAYGIAIFLAVVVFALGIILGNYVAEDRADTLGISQKAISALFDVFNSKNVSVLLDCNTDLNDLWKEKVNIGLILDALERRLGKENPKVLEQKHIYNDVQIKLFNIIKGLNDKCNYNWSIILFFYTNKDNDFLGSSGLSSDQGLILSTLSDKNQNVKIFSLDVNAKTNLTLNVMNRYNVSYVPYLVIDGKGYKGVLNRNGIQEIINK